jgi:hypothetical protein
MSTYDVRAVPWAEGWELHVDGAGVTQVRTLDKAARQVEDFIETITGKPVNHFSMDIRFSLGGLEDDVAEARRLVAEAAALQVEAGQRARVVARRLRQEKHLSVTDTAAVLGVSRGRVSQLTA